MVPPGSLDLLCRLFPEKKRSVLELVLRRCEHDLLKAIEHCVPLCKTLTVAPKSRKSSIGKCSTNTTFDQQLHEVNHFKLARFIPYRQSRYTSSHYDRFRIYALGFAP